MSNRNPAAYAAGSPLEIMIAGRALNLAGVAMLAMSVVISACILLSALPRTIGGIAIAAVTIVVGDLIARAAERTARSRHQHQPLIANQPYWVGTTLIAVGYGLAAFFAHAAHYVPAVSGFGSALPCWLLELTLAAVATIHLSKHELLRGITIPVTLLATANVFYHALASTETVSLLGLTVAASALASVGCVLWLGALTILHQKLEAKQPAEAAGRRLMHRVAHEGYFVLAAINALALPKYCGSIEYAPLWWAIETPILLAISWRSKSFIKHALVIGIWALSAVLLLGNKMDLSPVVRMAIPVSGIVMALTYRFVHSDWAHRQKKIGYATYLYGSVGVAIALPLFQMTPLEALPYWLAQSGVILAMAFLLKDKVLQYTGAVVAIGSLTLFGSQWQTWTWPMAIEVIAGCYIMSLMYGWIEKKGGLANSEFVPLPGKFALTKKQADWMEKGAGILGYITLIGASFLLIANPFNTVAWGAEAFSLIAFGFVTRKVGHRASGLLAMALASAKLTIFDLSGAGTLMRSLVSFGAVSVCCFAAGMFYMIEYGRLQKRFSDSDDDENTNKRDEGNQPEKRADSEDPGDKQ